MCPNYAVVDARDHDFGSLAGVLRITSFDLNGVHCFEHFFYADTGKFLHLLVIRQAGKSFEECEAAARTFFLEAAKRLQLHVAYLKDETA